MSDLTEFLLARLAEDEAGAIAAQRRIASWTKADVGPWITARHISEQVGPGAVLDAFIARHDPARVLAEVEAKRRIVEWDAEQPVDRGVLNILAAVYSDHADYDEAWRV